MSLLDLLQEVEDLGHKFVEIGVDFRQQTGRYERVEVPGERDLVSDLGLGVVDPGVGHVGKDFPFEVVLDLA